MFADTALAARIDRAEGRLVAGIAEAVRARRPETRTLVLPISGGVSVYGGPNSPINKVIGLGFDGPLDLRALEEIEREWHARGEAVRVELLSSRMRPFQWRCRNVGITSRRLERAGAAARQRSRHH